MIELPDKQIIEEAASELEINPAFVEKDWYVTQVIKLISSFSFEDFTMIFSGGTALAKAHDLLKRFSEDIDFRIIGPSLADLSQNGQKAKLSKLKNSIFAYLKKYFPRLQDEHLTGRNANRFFAIDLVYPTQFDHAAALRPHILLEFTVSAPSLPGIKLPVSSFIATVAGNSPEVKEIECINPVESAADKMSAFAWRTVDRQRGGEEDDPTIVRHLHDLCLLYPQAIAHKQFKKMVLETLQQDDRRSALLEGLSPREKFDRVVAIIKGDKEYENEYNRFVQGMSYAASADMPRFAQAISNLEALIAHVLKG
jgi:hypothetical protein